MAKLLSLQTCSRANKPRSSAAATTPRPSAAPLTTPANSASQGLSAMDFRTAGQRFNACDPHTRAPPLVDCRAARRPPKSVSTYAQFASSA
eukprot:14700265-Alexandrium_andersonii.AAC.1